MTRIITAAIAGGVTLAACGDAVGPTPDDRPVRVVTFGDSNTDAGWNGGAPEVVVRSYISRAPERLGPSEPNSALQLAGKIERRWEGARSNPITAVNHGIGGTTTGGGAGGGSDRHPVGSPHARAVVDGITRFEAEVLGRGGSDWNGGEPENEFYPGGAVVRAQAFEPAERDFAYVSMGTNDAESGLSAEQSVANLTWMADRWTDAGLPAEHFIITTLAPRDGSGGAGFPAINDAIRGLAEARGLHLIDLAAHTSADNGLTWRSDSLHVGDALHYSEAVRDWLAERVVEHMDRLLPAGR